MEQLSRHASRARAASRRRSRSVALAIAAIAGGACAARGPPPLTVDIALERARQALCTDGGIESPRALVAALVPEAPCPEPEAEVRLRCYLARRDTVIAVHRIRGGFRVRVVMPALSDHVHDVSIRRTAAGTIEVTLDSAN